MPGPVSLTLPHSDPPGWALPLSVVCPTACLDLVHFSLQMSSLQRPFFDLPPHPVPLLLSSVAWMTSFEALTSPSETRTSMSCSHLPSLLSASRVMLYCVPVPEGPGQRLRKPERPSRQPCTVPRAVFGICSSFGLWQRFPPRRAVVTAVGTLQLVTWLSHPILDLA